MILLLAKIKLRILVCSQVKKRGFVDQFYCAKNNARLLMQFWKLKELADAYNKVSKLCEWAKIRITLQMG